ncbi:ATP-binding protein [Paenibacillus barengoltzii]|uniref:ATP-binding protein n=1 Tax=Paenibacillus barengoltzii TaxID=343517 RepID=UPI002DBE53DF|nr:ATP-binding protein [Paenibacillus barengoltzii]MEC2344343.1 ATP-binding protein [Paenibacillus barengoltzii]
MKEHINLFDISENQFIGLVNKVDSYSVNISTSDEEQLRRVNVNGYVIMHTSDPNTRLIGRIERVVRLEYEQKALSDDINEDDNNISNDITVNALGTLKGPGGDRKRTVFTRAVENLPEIGAKCFLLLGEYLTLFTGLIADETAKSETPLILGTYTMASGAQAILDGNAFFQRHAMVVGSTGSGKSWTAARIIEQVAGLKNSNMVVFDLHGEYKPLSVHPHITRYRIAGPADLDNLKSDVLFLPYWLLGYEDMLALILDRSDENAPNQAMAFSNAVINAKRKALESENMQKELESFTIDSPVPYSLDDVVAELTKLNEERVLNKATGKENNGPFHGKFNRFLPRLASKRSDRRHGFLFSLKEEQLAVNYLDILVKKLMKANGEQGQGVKIIDFSEVPSDILPIVLSLVARLIFQVQQWSDSTTRHPIALVCDEAHLYLPNRLTADAAEARALAHFERIAKEGRKYGVSLLIISQRPSELNTTIMSQCNNVVALRLSNQSDKSAVSNLLPENLGGIQDQLPTLGVGEAIVVGDACLLPSRIKIQEPEYKPDSGSVEFWDEWSDAKNVQNLVNAVQNLRRQSSSSENNY